MHSFTRVPPKGFRMQASNVSFSDRVQPSGHSSWVEKRLLPLIFRCVGPAPVR
jgi:hypothetical protein